MRATSVPITAALLTLAVGAGAQAPAPAAAPVGRRYVALGCVERATPASAAPEFRLVDMRGDTPTVYRLDADAKDLEFYVGRTVEVTGPLSAPRAGAAGPNANALVLRVASLVYLSPTCKLLK